MDVDDAAPVFRLMYRSQSRLDPESRRAELGRIFATARPSNKEIGITGALLITDDEFVQVLEGPEVDVRALFDRIAQDDRHDQVELVQTTESTPRVFSRWAMAKVAEDGEPDIPLLNNRDKGGISPAAPRPVTADQEMLLGSMRTLLRHPTSA